LTTGLAGGGVAIFVTTGAGTYNPLSTVQLVS